MHHGRIKLSVSVVVWIALLHTHCGCKILFKYETIVIITDYDVLDITLGDQFDLVSVARNEGWRIIFMDEVFWFKIQ